MNPGREAWPALCRRAVGDDAVIEDRVRAILSRVRTGGDSALADITREVEGRDIAVLNRSGLANNRQQAIAEVGSCFGRMSPPAESYSGRGPQDASYRDSDDEAGCGRDVASEAREAPPKATAAVAEPNQNPFLVSAEEITAAEGLVSEELKAAIAAAAANIRAFHAAQKPAPVEVETAPGVRCVRRSRPIDRVGLYIPGGSAPLFSTLLMLAIPAQIAGCREIVLCTPAGRDGCIAPAVLYAASFCGIKTIYSLGGAQAIAAMAFGTETIAPVSKIFGPGNRYVTKAKQLVAASGVAIDMPAGPSEVMVLADDTADARFVASDLLSQAEHGPDSQALLVCRSERFAAEVSAEVDRQLALLPRSDIASKALENSRIIVFRGGQVPDLQSNIESACTPEGCKVNQQVADNQSDALHAQIAFANAYASEHLIIAMRDPWAVAEQITAAGSVFIGNYSPESAGDYASGTNHTLPTMGLARAWSGIGLDSFMHSITYQELTREGLESLGDTIITMAQAEGLDAHAAAVKCRLER